MKRILGISLLALLAGLPVQASTIFLDQPSFLAAFPPGFSLQTFDGMGTGLQASNLTFPGFGAAAANGLFGVPNPAQPADLWLSTNTPTDPVSITFLPSVMAVGGFFFPTDIFGSVIPGTILVTGSDGTVVNLPTTDTLPNAFLGIIASTPMTWLTVEALQQTGVPSGVFPAVNDLFVGVPEPATTTLIGLALLVGCGLLRRKKA